MPDSRGTAAAPSASRSRQRTSVSVRVMKRRPAHGRNGPMPADPTPIPRRRRLPRAALGGLLLGAALALGFEVVRVVAGPNVHVVIPGAVYRSAQPSARRLDDLIRTHGIRTV